MKLSNDQVERLLRGSRPDLSNGYARGTDGKAVLKDVLTTGQRSAKRRRPSLRATLAATALGVVFVGGATAAIARYDAPIASPEYLPASDSAFVCSTEGLQSQAETGLEEGEEPVDACRRIWRRVFDEEAPQSLFSCVIGGPTPSTQEPIQPPAGKLIYIIDGDKFNNAPETCGSVGLQVAPVRPSTSSPQAPETGSSYPVPPTPALESTRAS